MLNMDLTLITDDDVYTYYHGYKQNNPGDSGIDIVMPKKVILFPGQTCIVDLSIRAIPSTSFQLVPRSSISKTPFRQSNSPAIIDQGYRGKIKAAIECNYPSAFETTLYILWIFYGLQIFADGMYLFGIINIFLCINIFINSHTHIINPGDKLFQIIAPNLGPINLKIINETEINVGEIIKETQRGEGGFGSTNH